MTIAASQKPANANANRQNPPQALGGPALPDGSATGAMPLDMSCLRQLILTRIAAQKGATRTDLAKDIAPHAAHKLSPAEWRSNLDTILGALISGGLITEKSGRLHASKDGIDAAQTFLGMKGKVPASWNEIAYIRVMAKALGLERAPAKTLKTLDRPDTLRAVILQQGFALKLKGLPTPARVRSALAITALERAFGNQITSNLGSGAGLSAKAARLLAGQLSSHPRDFGTDRRLIAALAAETLGAVQVDIASLQNKLFRLVLSAQTLQPCETPPPKPSTKKAAARRKSTSQRGKKTPRPNILTTGNTHATPAANGQQSAAIDRPARESAPLKTQSINTQAPSAEKPDLTAFTKEVHRQASHCAQGWSGDRKAFISHVWQSIRKNRPEWGLSDIEFKCMLLEAHHTGHVLLSYADLKDKNNLEDVKNSAIAYKSTVWHFIRVEE